MLQAIQMTVIYTASKEIKVVIKDLEKLSKNFIKIISRNKTIPRWQIANDKIDRM